MKPPAVTLPLTLPLAGLLAGLLATPLARADWPMPGHDPQRSSYSASDACTNCTSLKWSKNISAMIPSRAQLITVEGKNGTPDLLLVPTSEGVLALDPAGGAEKWSYKMDLPVGDAPAVVDGVVYVGGTDKTIHAVNLATGQKLWQTDEAGAAFYVSPLVVNGRVYAGSRDGYFYCFAAKDGVKPGVKAGGLLWFYKAGAPISFSAAFQTYAEHPAGLVFFAAHDGFAYALKADSGQLHWKSPRLPASRFSGYWPVVAGDRVLLASATHYPTHDGTDLNGLARDAGILFPDMNAVLQKVNASPDKEKFFDLSSFTSYLDKYPERRSVYVLDRTTGQQKETAPFLWFGNPGGQRFPPAVDHRGYVWASSAFITGFYAWGRLLVWKPGTKLARPFPLIHDHCEAGDEPDSFSLVGTSLLLTAGGDGQDKAGFFPGALNLEDKSVALQSFMKTDYGANYSAGWKRRKYGNHFVPGGPWQGSVGWHGHQNAPVPLKGKMYFHRSNAVVCMGQ